MPQRAMIADDHELFRSGLKQLLHDLLSIEDVREAETLDQAIEILTNEGAGDLVLVDLNMPGMSGPEALAALRDGFPDAKVAVVSAWDGRAEIIAALSAGVHGYIPKSMSSNEIAGAIRSILDGQIFVPPALGKREPTETPRMSAHVVDANGGEKLTIRQREVLGELLKGRASKEIARAR